MSDLALMAATEWMHANVRNSSSADFGISVAWVYLTCKDLLDGKVEAEPSVKTPGTPEILAAIKALTLTVARGR